METKATFNNIQKTIHQLIDSIHGQIKIMYHLSYETTNVARCVF